MRLKGEERVMNCCNADTERRPRRAWWRNVSGCVGSGALLVMLPKCPMCIAAYVALWSGAGVAMPIATRLRPLLEVMFVVSVALLIVRIVAMRSRQPS
jgi:hypothetical protein